MIFSKDNSNQNYISNLLHPFINYIHEKKENRNIQKAQINPTKISIPKNIFVNL